MLSNVTRISFVVAVAHLIAGAGCSSDNGIDRAVGASLDQRVGQVSQAVSVPAYDHIFLIINENHNFAGIIKNPAAPILNALANDYGLATSYTGVSDPSEPNYVAMLGGSDFGINSDDPYFFPGHTVNQPNLMSQLEGAGKTWRAYFQDLPYAGYRGYCFPGKCNGIPDSDTQYVAKHNGIANFANMQTATEWIKQTPYGQLATDLASGSVPNFSYIVADECNDMHGAPPWCVDSGKAGDVDDTWLVAQGDKFVGQTVNLITSSATWMTGTNAIVVTFDEGNTVNDQIYTAVIVNHGPRGVTDQAQYNHYSLLATLQQAFGLGCLQNSCNANAMGPLFQITGSTTVPALPAPFTPPPNGTNSISAQGSGTSGKPVSLTGSGWVVVPSPSIGNSDNNLAAVSAASATDAWAVGSYYAPSNTNVLNAMAEHFDGTRWTEFPLPNVGLNENSLLGVSELPNGHAWAVGYFVNATYQQQTLVEYYNGTVWSVVTSPSPGARQNILYGVTALSDNDVWAVGTQEDNNDVFHTLTMHWDGSMWTAKTAVDAGASGNQFYAVTNAGGTVYATGQQSGSSFPSQILVEQWNSKSAAWSVVSTPSDATASPLPLGLTAGGSTLSLVGDTESSTAPYTTLVAAGAPGSQQILSTPNNGSGENDLFAAATAADGSTWAVGWYINASGTHQTLTEQGVGGVWSLAPSPNVNTGDNGLAGVAAIPGGGLWAVGVSAGKGNFSTLIMWHP
jgi:hypothetical protein